MNALDNTRREVLKVMGLGALSLAGRGMATASEDARKRPNVLVIHVDQHRFDSLGVCGNTDVKTPNIDRLAADGVRYENSFCSYPVCTPSRYSLISGKYVHEHGGFNNRCTILPDCDTFPRILGAAGYKTKAVGKMHYTPTYLDVGFEEMQLSEQDGPGRWDDDYHRYLRDHGLVDRNDLEDQRKEYREKAPAEYWETAGALVSNLPEKHHSTTWIGDRAVETLEEWDDASPGLLMAGFIKPHHPFDPPAPWHEMYDPSALSILPGWTEENVERDYRYSRGYFDTQKLTLPVLRRAMAYYYATISQIDHHVGRMIDTLKKKNLYDNTMIVFTSDHGEFLGFHHMLLKGNYMYDPLARVPLIVKYPNSAGAGEVSASLVNTVDVAPTILGAVGLESDNEMSGLDLRSHPGGHEVALCGRTEVMARTQTHKLIISRRKQGQNLFFELEKDPLEMKNQYDAPACQAKIRELTAAINEWQPEEFLTRQVYVNHDAPLIKQPNVPPQDLSHREAIIEYYEEKMQG